MATEPILHDTPGITSRNEARSTYSFREAYRHQTVSIMRLVVILCAVVTAATLAWTYGIWRASVGRPPLIVGVNEATGATYVLRPDAVRMRLTDQMLRYFLLHWTEGYFQRLAIGEGDYRKSLLFMSSRITTSGKGLDEDLKQFEAVRRGESGEVAIRATNAVIQQVDDVLANGCSDQTGRFCTALVQFERTVGAEKIPAVVQVQFVMLSEVPERIVAVNPLGFVITGFHVSEGR